MDLKKINNIHFIGIGGIGISAVARMLFLEGKNISANDLEEFEIVSNLRKLGINTIISKDSSCIPADTDLIVYSIAWTTLGPELLDYAKSLNIPIRTYPEMLGIISEDKYTIAVCGTHGKTTTTGMLAQIWKEAKLDPTVIVGSLLKEEDGTQTNYIHGEGEHFIVEACEYRRSFLNINPNIVVITNIDTDHLDYYKDIDDIKNAFRAFVEKLPEDGYVICNISDPNIFDVVNGIKAKVVNWEEYFDSNLKLKIPGIHNKKNAASAIATAVTLGISKQQAESFVGNFSGTWKRFEYRGELKDGTLLYDDYAHHPKEITSTLQGFREIYPKSEDLSADEMGWNIIVVFQPHLFSRTKLLLSDFAQSFYDADEAGWNITVVFQPHLFSRTKFFLSDFAQSFYDADKVIVLPIYYAREVDDGTVSSEILSGEINKFTNNSKAFSSFEQAETYLEAKLRSNMGAKLPYFRKNVIVTMGAGEASKIGDFLLKNYK